MGKKDKYHQKLNSLNPAWCLLPPPTKVAAAAATATNTPRYNFNTSPLVTYRPTTNKKKTTTTTTTRHPRDSPKVPVEEPTSPRIGCMGQIRRCKPPPDTTTPSLVRSKSSSLKSTWSTASPPAAGMGRLVRLQGFSTLARVETVEGMDPPRPVERKEEEVGERSSISLWKRRCGSGSGGGAGLRLQTEQITN